MSENLNNTSRPRFITRLFRWAFSWRVARRSLITVAILATLIAAIYSFENWRGQRAWEKCKRDLIAAGYEMDWNKLIPPPIPDEQNIFKPPHMQDWLARFSSRAVQDTNSFPFQLKHSSAPYFGKESRITNAVEAVAFLEWSHQFEPEFNLISTALQRPYARMDGNYSRPFEIPIPNFVALRNFAQTFTQRAHCHLLLKQSNEAMADLTFVHDLRKFCLGKPSGKPMTLVSAMIHVAITGLYTTLVEEGLQTHAWQEKQLIEIESQLSEITLAEPVREAFRCELTAVCHAFEQEPFGKLMGMSSVVIGGASDKGTLAKIWNEIKRKKLHVYDCAPRGWLQQNLVVHARLMQMVTESLQGMGDAVSPQRIEDVQKTLEAKLAETSLFNLIAKIGIPNSRKAIQSTTRNQTTVHLARIAIALERHHIAHKQYPETLAALVPQFITKLPHDVINGQPLKYRRTETGGFILYSVGWNEKDDSGTVVMGSGKTPSVDQTQGDWVWASEAK
jgi:hypothetical protein